VLRGVRRGAKLYVVDPRRTVSAQWADLWLGLDVGSDIALANAMGREILAAGLENRAFIAGPRFDTYARVEVHPGYAERETGVSGAIRELAHVAPRHRCSSLDARHHRAHNAR
jgi:formate dehydrogenase major subunit